MYKLSNLAVEDFEQIFEYTFKNFGEEQADNYTNSLEYKILALSKNPKLGRQVPEILDLVYRCEHEKHSIFYRINKKEIFVLRILHQQMNIIEHL